MTTTLKDQYKVLIVGASGHLGSSVCKFLCDNHKNEVNLSLLVPHEESKKKIQNCCDKITGDILTMDILTSSVDEISNILKDFTLVLNCMNFMDSKDEYKAEHNLIQACVKAGVTHYIPSDFSIDFRNVKKIDMLPRLEVRKKIHTELNQLNSKLKWTSILCGVIIEKLLCDDCHLIDRKQKTFSFYGNGDEKFQASSYEDIGRFVSELICRKEQLTDKFAFKYLPVFSETISFNNISHWLKDIWAKDFKVNNLGGLDVLDKKIQEVHKKTDESSMNEFYYLQYLKLILMDEGKLNETQLDNEIWPSISKVGLKNVIRDWVLETTTSM